MERGSGAATGLLDRTDERATLRGALDTARSGRGSMVVVEGKPGIGKTSLIRAIAKEARSEGWQVTTCRGSQLEQEFAFGVVRQLLAAGDLSSDLTSSAVAEQESDRTLVEVLSEQSATSAGARSAASEFQLLHEVYWWFVRRTDKGALLVVVDDAQWADLSSLRFLRFLALRLDQLPLALVVAAREPDEPRRAELVAALAGDPSGVVVEPRVLSRPAVTQLVTDTLGAPAELFIDACQRVSGGNPLMLSELLRELRLQHIVPDTDAVAVVERVGPGALRRHVSARLTGYPGSYRALAQAIAVLGPGAPLQQAAALAGLTGLEADAAADGLISLDLVSLDDGVSFNHPLLAAVLYQSIAPRSRAREHERAAELLLAQRAPAERVAAHYLNVSPAGAAQRTAVLGAAALEARRRGATHSAGVYLRRALDEPPPPQMRSEVARQLGNCEAYSLDWTPAEQHLREAVDLAASDDHRALAAFSLGRFLEVTQRPDEGARVLERAIAQLGDAVPDLRLRMAAELAGYDAVVLTRRSQWPDTLERLRQIRNAHWEPLDRVLLAHSALLSAMSGAAADMVAARAEAAFEGDLLAPDLSALYIAVTALITTGRYTETDRHLRRATSWGQTGGLAVAESFARAYLAAVALRRGDIAEAQAELDAGWSVADGPDHSVPVLLGCQLELHVERGEFDQAAQLLIRQPITPQIVSTQNGLRAVYGRARYLLATGQHRAALDDFEKLRDLYAQWQAEALLDQPWRSGTARVCWALGQLERAAALIDEELSLARSFGAARPLGIALQAAAEIHDHHRLDYAHEAVAVLEPSEARLELARAQALLGRLLLAQGDRQGGRQQLRDSLDGAAAAGAEALSAAVRTRLMRAGGRPPPLRRTGIGALTPTERRVATMVAKEMTNREIARELYVTEKTIETHLTNAFRKLEVRSRQDLGRLVTIEWNQGRFPS